MVILRKALVQPLKGHKKNRIDADTDAASFVWLTQVGEDGGF